MPFDVDVAGPVAVDVGVLTGAALVQRGIIVGGGADGGGVEVVK